MKKGRQLTLALNVSTLQARDGRTGRHGFAGLGAPLRSHVEWMAMDLYNRCGERVDQRGRPLQ
jgi:hypothetical protein